MSAATLFPGRFLLASQVEENSSFLRLIFFSLLLQFARNTRAAAAGHKQNHQHPRNFHYCSQSWKLFLLRKKVAAEQKAVAEKKTTALLLILNTRKQQ
jgi:hypothetical protein